jgi:hypothetical protein
MKVVKSIVSEIKRKMNLRLRKFPITGSIFSLTISNVAPSNSTNKIQRPVFSLPDSH